MLRKKRSAAGGSSAKEIAYSGKHKETLEEMEETFPMWCTRAYLLVHDNHKTEPKGRFLANLPGRFIAVCQQIVDGEGTPRVFLPALQAASCTASSSAATSRLTMQTAAGEQRRDCIKNRILRSTALVTEVWPRTEHWTWENVLLKVQVKRRVLVGVELHVHALLGLPQ